MKLAIALALTAGLLSLPVRAAEPDLSEQAINGADFAAWQQRLAPPAMPEPAPGDGGTVAVQPPAPETPAPKTTVAEIIAAETAAGGGEAAAPPLRPDPFLIRLQVLLGRANVSPGVIDGYPGANLDKAVRAFEEMRGLPVDGQVDADLWAMLAADAAPAVSRYAVTKEDVDGRYVKSIPEDYAEMAKLDWLGFRGPAEMLAERFHMDEDLIKALNPGADWTEAGAEILVADVGAPPAAKVVRILVDKSDGELRAFGEDGALVAAYPATIGSEDNPSPEGEVTVEVVVHDPGYTYDPDKNFQQGDNREAMDIPPGPNGPVGNVWIDLSKPTYGIHGTPEPSKIDKTASHGCVRLANWDAAALADMVEPKRTVVVFQE